MAIATNLTTTYKIDEGNTFTPCLLTVNCQILDSTISSGSTPALEKMGIAEHTKDGTLVRVIVAGTETNGGTAEMVEAKDISENISLVKMSGSRGHNIIEYMNRMLTSSILVEIDGKNGSYRSASINFKRKINNKKLCQY